ncbi:ATP-dependent DNA helicase [Trichonephila clavipes]|nr:ATP-dependent DNA helicase [Trichonephila clavipes]
MILQSSPHRKCQRSCVPLKAFLRLRLCSFHPTQTYFEQLHSTLIIIPMINTVSNPEEALNYPTEFLNSIIVPGLPPHKLELNIDVPIILTRNLNPPKLCIGTRLRVASLQKKRTSHNNRMRKRNTASQIHAKMHIFCVECQSDYIRWRDWSDRSPDLILMERARNTLRREIATCNPSPRSIQGLKIELQNESY